MFTLWRNTSPSSTLREAVAQVDATFANRFHLGTEQRDARLERLEDVVVVKRLAVLGDVGLRQLAFGFLLHVSRRSDGAAHGRARQARRQPDRRNQAARIRDALARDVERGAVIDRGPDDRQAEGHVDRLTERKQLHRNQTLIVVAGDDDVEFAAGGAEEHRVARKRAMRRRCPRARQPSIAGRMTSDSSRAEQAVLAGVRIEAGDGDPRPRNAEARQLARSERDRRRRDAPASTCAAPPTADVHRREHDPQAHRE